MAVRGNFSGLEGLQIIMSTEEQLQPGALDEV